MRVAPTEQKKGEEAYTHAHTCVRAGFPLSLRSHLPIGVTHFTRSAKRSADDKGCGRALFGEKLGSATRWAELGIVKEKLAGGQVTERTTG